ncbi:MAG: hypothetical protein MJ087_02490 [Lachnospiraceae bacterium]|nr:hypothetical protein [Lachnospiraceae bacterium]
MAVLKRIYDEQSWEERLSKNKIYDLKELCDRLSLHEEWVLSNLDYPAFFYEYFSDHYETVLMLLSKDELELLIRIWNPKEILELSEINQRHLVSLEGLGLIRFSYQNKEVYVNRDAKTNLCFYLRSRSSKRKMEEYQQLEYAIKGVLYQCGIISVQSLYDMLKDGPLSITRQFVQEFAIARMNLWSFAGVLRNRLGEYYLECFEVHNREQVFKGWLKQDDDFAPLSFENAQSLGKAGGIGMWKGVPELISLLMRTIIKDSMATTIFIKTIILYLQNGDSVEQVMNKVESKIKDFTEQEREQFEKLLCLMYDSIPLYEKKGHTRGESKLVHGGFTLIPGGKE